MQHVVVIPRNGCFTNYFTMTTNVAGVDTGIMATVTSVPPKSKKKLFNNTPGLSCKKIYSGLPLSR